VFTVGLPVLMGALAVATWRRTLPARPEPEPGT